MSYRWSAIKFREKGRRGHYLWRVTLANQDVKRGRYDEIPSVERAREMSCAKVYARFLRVRMINNVLFPYTYIIH